MSRPAAGPTQNTGILDTREHVAGRVEAKEGVSRVLNSLLYLEIDGTKIHN